MDAYQAYLLRLWRVETENGPVWRAALEDAHSEIQQSFADLSELFAFLMKRTGAGVEISTEPLSSPNLEQKSKE